MLTARTLSFVAILSSLVTFGAVAKAETSLACVTPVSSNQVQVRFLKPKSGKSVLKATVDNVDSIATSAIARHDNDVVFVGRTNGSTSDQLISVNVVDGTSSVVTPDVSTINTLFFKGSELRAFVSNSSTSAEEYRTFDRTTGISTLLGTISGFGTAQLGAFARAKNGSRALHISNNSDGSQTLYSIRINNGVVVKSKRLKTPTEENAEIEKLKRLLAPKLPNAQHAGVYKDNNSGEVRFARVRESGVVFKTRLLPLENLAEGHTLVTSGQRLFVLGTESGSSDQVLLQVDKNGAVVNSATLKNSVQCAILKFGKNSEPD